MATVHLGRLAGAAGFRRLVAVKRLHPHLAADPYFRSMLIDEARLAGRVHHPSVVGTIDVLAADGQLLVVMEYIHGQSLSALLHAANENAMVVPLPIASAIVSDTLHGLHAAHEARDERGEPLGLVHRDISPPNVLVGADGIGRVADFGIAKAAGRLQLTRAGQVKGKFAYMAPEQLEGTAVDRRADVYAASAILWELIVGRPLFAGESEADVFRESMLGRIPHPSEFVPDVPEALQDATMRGLSRNPADRYATARDMALSLEAAMPPATARRVADWMADVARDALAQRATQIAAFERVSFGADEEGPPSAERPVALAPKMAEYVAAVSGVPGPVQRTAVSDRLPEGWYATPASPPSTTPAEPAAPVAPVAPAAAPAPSTAQAPPAVAAVPEPPMLGPLASAEARSLEREFRALADGGAVGENGAARQAHEDEAPTVIRERSGGASVAPVTAARREPVPPLPREPGKSLAAAAPPGPGFAAVSRSWGDRSAAAAWWGSKVAPRILAMAGGLQAASPWRLMVGLAFVALLVGTSPLVCMVAAGPRRDSVSRPSGPPETRGGQSREPPSAAETPAAAYQPARAPVPVAQELDGSPELTPAPRPSPPAAQVPGHGAAAPPISRGPSRIAGPASPPGTASRRCDPPWTIGNDGIRHPKPECL
jgi:serine/threonine-protein kinase